MTTKVAVLETALQALANGACPIPGMADGSKRPMGNWNHWQEQRPTEDQLRSWFGDVPNSERLAQWLHRLSSGNPLHLAELLPAVKRQLIQVIG